MIFFALHNVVSVNTISVLLQVAAEDLKRIWMTGRVLLWSTWPRSPFRSRMKSCTRRTVCADCCTWRRRPASGHKRWCCVWTASGSPFKISRTAKWWNVSRWTSSSSRQLSPASTPKICTTTFSSSSLAKIHSTATRPKCTSSSASASLPNWSPKTWKCTWPEIIDRATRHEFRLHQTNRHRSHRSTAYAFLSLELFNEEPVMFNRCFYYCCYAGQPRSFHASHQRRRQFNFERTLREGRDGVEPLLRRHRALHRPFATRGRGSPRARTPQKVCRFFLYLHSPRGLVITRCPPSFHRLVFYLISVVVNSKEISKFHPSVRYRWLREMLFICWHHFFYLFLTSRLIRYLKIRSRKSKKKEQGDGMLSMRARPPSEAEYIDIFQKFKLSFNLLVSGFLRLHWNWICKMKIFDWKTGQIEIAYSRSQRSRVGAFLVFAFDANRRGVARIQHGAQPSGPRRRSTAHLRRHRIAFKLPVQQRDGTLALAGRRLAHTKVCFFSLP